MSWILFLKKLENTKQSEILFKKAVRKLLQMLPLSRRLPLMRIRGSNVGSSVVWDVALLQVFVGSCITERIQYLAGLSIFLAHIG
jgi:hypothetical protein